MDVRDYELDQFGVVNNKNYLGFTQHARHVMLAGLGFPCDDRAREGEALAISEVNVKYLSPLRSGDRFIVAVKVDQLTKARVVFVEQIVLLPPETAPRTASLSSSLDGDALVRPPIDVTDLPPVLRTEVRPPYTHPSI